jgi:hypothetical protein
MCLDQAGEGLTLELNRHSTIGYVSPMEFERQAELV